MDDNRDGMVSGDGVEQGDINLLCAYHKERILEGIYQNEFLSSVSESSDSNKFGEFWPYDPDLDAMQCRQLDCPGEQAVS